MLDAGFVAAVLRGFEGTLDGVVGRVASPELGADLAVLQTRINALRGSLKLPEAENYEFCGNLVVALPTGTFAGSRGDRVALNLEQEVEGVHWWRINLSCRYIEPD